MKRFIVLLLVGSCLGGLPLQAQKRVLHPFTHQGEAAKQGQLQVLAEVSYPNTTFLRLYFKGTQLGEISYLLLEAADGAQQVLRRADLENWRFSSAYFNGTTVKVSLYAAAGEKNLVSLSEVMITDEEAERARKARKAAEPAETSARTVHSTAADITETYPYAKAVGRFTDGSESYGTGWIAPNGAIVTSPTIAYRVNTEGFDVIEFNVPASVGTTVQHPAPQDQYPVEFQNEYGYQSTVFKGENYILNVGWAVVEALPNSTGLRPGERQQEYFRIATNPSNYTIDAMGDVPVDLFHYGNIAGDNLVGLGTYRTLRLTETTLLKQNTYLGKPNGGGADRDLFVLYTMPLFLGSHEGAPVAYEGSNVAVGVHNDIRDDNPAYGLGFRDDGFRNGLARFFSNTVAYVDFEGLYNSPTGEIHKPYLFASQAASSAPVGAQVYFARGNYSGAVTFNRAMTLRAPVGTVTIGASPVAARKAGPTIPHQLLAEGPSPSFDDQSAEERRVGASPNPFRDEVTISYEVSRKGPVSVAVFNGGGAEVARLASGEAEAGSHTVRWGGTDRTGTPVAPGLYFVRVNAGSQTLTTKVLKQ